MSEYYIIAQVWNRRHRKYESKILFETQNDQRAKDRFSKMNATIDTPILELYVVSEDYNTRLERKVCLERDFVERLEG